MKRLWLVLGLFCATGLADDCPPSSVASILTHLIAMNGTMIFDSLHSTVANATAQLDSMYSAKNNNNASTLSSEDYILGYQCPGNQNERALTVRYEANSSQKTTGPPRGCGTTWFQTFSSAIQHVVCVGIQQQTLPHNLLGQ